MNREESRSRFIVGHTINNLLSTCQGNYYGLLSSTMLLTELIVKAVEKISRRELAKRVGVSAATVSNAYDGHTVNSANLKKFADYFHVSIDALMSDPRSLHKSHHKDILLRRMDSLTEEQLHLISSCIEALSSRDQRIKTTATTMLCSLGHIVDECQARAPTRQIK